jgi:hypothetical protein
VITNNSGRTKNNSDEHYKIHKGIIKKNFYWLVELNLCKNMSREVLDTIYNEIPEVYKGMAVIAQRPYEQMVAGYFLRLSEKNIPSKMFLSTKEARDWIKQLK